ncbi:MAG: AI-2E family transporter [Oscillospiraceae bacterium]|jgi:predicted PurR-regulated permease PerM|nr:AI-2E family transporter [Oscillospiraceae bacterium]
MRNIHKYLKILILAICVLLAYKLLFDFVSVAEWFGRIIGIISPFIAGFVIAFCLNIPVSWLELKIRKIKFKWVRKIARSASILIVLAIVIFIIALGLSLLIPMIFNNIAQLAELIPTYYEQALTFIERLPFADTLGLTEQIQALREGETFEGFEFDLAGGWLVAQGLFSGLFTTILTIVSTIYFLLEYNRMRDFFKRLIGVIGSDKKRGATLKYVRLVDLSFRKFISCQVLDSLILATITTILFFVLESSYALVLGILLGVLNIIPYFGSIFGSIIASLIMAFDRGLEIAVITAIILLIVQQIDGNYINPKIMGTSFKVSPVLVIIAITIGGAIGGVPGMIFAIPVVNVLKTILEEFIENREKLKNSNPVEIAPASD